MLNSASTSTMSMASLDACKSTVTSTPTTPNTMGTITCTTPSTPGNTPNAATTTPTTAASVSESKPDMNHEYKDDIETEVKDVSLEMEQEEVELQQLEEEDDRPEEATPPGSNTTSPEIPSFKEIIIHERDTSIATTVSVVVGQEEGGGGVAAIPGEVAMDRSGVIVVPNCASPVRNKSLHVAVELFAPTPSSITVDTFTEPPPPPPPPPPPIVISSPETTKHVSPTRLCTDSRNKELNNSKESCDDAAGLNKSNDTSQEQEDEEMETSIDRFAV